MFLGKCQRFWDRKYLDLRGTRTPNIRIHAECSNLLSYQGQTLLSHVVEYWLWRYRYFWSKVNIWNVNSARATAFIHNTTTSCFEYVTRVALGLVAVYSAQWQPVKCLNSIVLLVWSPVRNAHIWWVIWIEVTWNRVTLFLLRCGHRHGLRLYMCIISLFENTDTTYAVRVQFERRGWAWPCVPYKVNVTLSVGVEKQKIASKQRFVGNSQALCMGSSVGTCLLLHRSIVLLYFGQLTIIVTTLNRWSHLLCRIFSSFPDILMFWTSINWIGKQIWS